MKLSINSVKNDSQTIEVTFCSESGAELLVLSEEARYKQAENLLPLIQRGLAQLGLSWEDVSHIEVSDNGGSFSALRVGVLTANALAFALGRPVRGTSGNQPVSFSGYDIVPAVYNREPNIGPPRLVA